MEAVLTDHFSVRHPRIQFIDTSQQSWDGWYRKYDSRRSRIARPLLQELIGLCEKHGFPLEIEDLRADPQPIDQSLIDSDMVAGITLYDYQVNAIKSASENDCGIVHVPTGGGKTEIMAGIVKMFNTATVIIADQRIVIEQIKERLELRKIVDEVGLFYGGSRPNGQCVVVGSIQSLMSPPASLRRKNFKQWKKRKENAEKFQAIVKASGLLLVDECDKATDKRYRKLFTKYFNGRYKFGFSGTPFDKDKQVEALILKEHMGSIIYKISRREVEKVGRIIPIRATMVAVGEDGDKRDRTAFDIAQRELIIENDDYHQKILQIVNAFPEDKTLILVDTNNVEDLGKVLESKIKGSVFIYGKTSNKKRHQALDALKSGELKCLIGGKILKRGLDIKGGVHNLIICGGGKLHSDFDQKVGRAVRLNERGWARLFCFFHLDNHYLYKHSKEQLKSIVEMGYGVKVAVHGQTVLGPDLIKARFRLPKKKA
jgi:superfamily II DNA or RNA helicase